MSTRVIIWPAKPVWPSARKLKEALKHKLPHKKILLIGSKNTKFKPRASDIFINWGNSGGHIWPEVFPKAYVNHQHFVSKAVNKLFTFTALKQNNIPTPEWTIDKDLAQNWIEVNPNTTVIGRKTLTSYGGKGIDLFEQCIIEEEYPLYVKYKKKKHEYRVHVFNGEVIDVTQKRKRKGVNVDYKIRNYKNGWVYCRDDVVEPADLRPVSLAAVAALGLDFGAVDVIWNEKENKCYVLEVNTAPGLVGTTLESYANAFTKEITK